MELIAGIVEILVSDNAKPRTSILKSEFRRDHAFDKRKAESARIVHKYPDRIPVICEILPSYKNELHLDKTKYLVPYDLTVGQLLYTIRRRLKLTPDKAIFLYLENNTLPASTHMISTLYEYNKNEDGFLYVAIGSESVFG